MRLFKALALSALAAGLAALVTGYDPFGAISIALAQPTDLPPGMTITLPGEPVIHAPGFVPASLAPWWNYIATPAVLFWIAAQFRAWFPFLGHLGWLTVIGDWIAGNYGAAKNAR